MTRKPIIHSLALLLAVLLFLTQSACSFGNGMGHDHLEEIHETSHETPLTKVLLTSTGLEYRIRAIEHCQIAYPYVSTVAFDSGTKALLDSIPNRLEAVRNNLEYFIAEPSPEAEAVIQDAFCDVAPRRLSIAQSADCPNEVLVIIACYEADPLVRYDAIGNILSRPDFPAELLEKMAVSEFWNTRFAALLHDNRTGIIANTLLDDPDPDVRAEAEFALGSAA